MASSLERTPSGTLSRIKIDEKPRLPVLNDHLLIDDAMDSFGNTPLHFAAMHEDYTLCSMLLLKGANPNSLNYSKVSPAHVALRLKNQTLVQLFHRHGVQYADWELSLVKPIAAAAEEDKPTNGIRFQTPVQRFKAYAKGPSAFKSRLLDYAKNQKLKSAYKFPTTGLSIQNSAYMGMQDEIQDLVTRFPHFAHSKNNYEQNAIMKATVRNHEAIVNFLISCNVDLDAKDIHHHDVLSWAILSDRVELVEKYIRNKSVNLKSRNVWGMTYLMLAAFVGNQHVVKLLLDNGADSYEKIDKANVDSFTIASWMLKDRTCSLLYLHTPHSVAHRATELPKFLDMVVKLWLKNIDLNNYEDKLDAIRTAMDPFLVPKFNRIYELIVCGELPDAKPVANPPKYITHLNSELEVCLVPLIILYLTFSPHLVNMRPLFDRS